ncbi:ankyrin repeat domain-containing protein 9-like [Ptychodera flava]|uniref:ankyrin repeat domain-containing protein 9-like n=1 Tax=Ptychodera flava TaxID=63121 RepID=UPI00396A119D
MAFYNLMVIAIRNQKQPMKIEKVRKRVVYDWEEELDARFFTRADALALAIEHNHIEYVDYLLKYHLDEALDTSKRCCTHLILAVTMDRQEIVEKILFYTSKQLRLLKSIDGKAWKKIESRSLARGQEITNESVLLCDEDYEFYINRKSCNPMGSSKTALHVACELALVECLRTLLSYGANPATPDLTGQTPLEYCLSGAQVKPESEGRRLAQCMELLVRTLRYIGVPIREQLKDLKIIRPNDDFIQNIDFPECPMFLAHLTRCTIRNCVDLGRLPHGINRLPLPLYLKKYLTLEM